MCCLVGGLGVTKCQVRVATSSAALASVIPPNAPATIFAVAALAFHKCSLPPLFPRRSPCPVESDLHSPVGDTMLSKPKRSPSSLHTHPFTPDSENGTVTDSDLSGLRCSSSHVRGSLFHPLSLSPAPTHICVRACNHHHHHHHPSMCSHSCAGDVSCHRCVGRWRRRRRWR
jgi:hypothetical protein